MLSALAHVFVNGVIIVAALIAMHTFIVKAELATSSLEYYAMLTGYASLGIGIVGIHWLMGVGTGTRWQREKGDYR